MNMNCMIRESCVSGMSDMARDLAKRAVSECAKMYGFSAEEAVRNLCLDSVSVSVSASLSDKRVRVSNKVDKKKVVRSAFPLPYNGELDVNCCNGLRLCEGLYTQCRVQKKGEKEFCKVCEEQAEKNNGVPNYGSIKERKACYDANEEFKDPNGKLPVAYCQIMKKYKVSEEQVLEEAGKQGITVNASHFAIVSSESKRGRPKSKKEVKEPKGAKGRPKKTKKVLEIDSGEDDLFASLLASANDDNESQEESKDDDVLSNISSEASEKEAKAKKDAEEKEAKALEKAKKEAEKEAKALEKAKKEAEKQAKALEKAKKEAEKQAKAEEKAKKEAEKEAKAEEKAKEKEAKAKKESENEEADIVKKFEFEGKKYLKSKKTGIIYNMEQDVIGKWNDVTNKIDFNEEEDEEEEEEYEEDD